MDLQTDYSGLLVFLVFCQWLFHWKICPLLSWGLPSVKNNTEHRTPVLSTMLCSFTKCWHVY